jgi:hypothetical protein
VPRSPNPKDPALGLDAMHALLNPETGRCAMVGEKWLREGPLGQAKSATGHNSHWLVREEAPSNADLVAAWRAGSERGRVSRGHDRERALKALLEGDDWLVVRAAASLGVADLVALRAGSRPRVIEVKSTSGGPYERFQPVERGAPVARREAGRR